MQDESLMTETEFYAKIDRALKQAEEGKVLEIKCARIQVFAWFMIYQIKFSEEALKDIERLKRKWKQICIKEISEVVLELQEHPIQELVR
jgi:hypothetical protein